MGLQRVGIQLSDFHLTFNSVSEIPHPWIQPITAVQYLSTYLLKYPPTSGPTQFKLVLFKGQCIFTLYNEEIYSLIMIYVYMMKHLTFKTENILSPEIP